MATTSERCPRRVLCIVNPKAGAAVERICETFHKHLRSAGITFEMARTERQGHATALARTALQEGWRQIIALGGDGTANEVLNGFFLNRELIAPQAVLGILPGGTGADFTRSLNAPVTPVSLCELILAQKTRQIDIGRLTCESLQGQPVSRYFMNVADAGYGGEMVRRQDGLKRVLPRSLVYFAGIFFTLFSYRNLRISCRIDGSEEYTGRFNSIMVANANYFGHGIWIAPEAKLDDGLFDITFVGDLNKLEVILNIRRLYNGTLHTHKKVQFVKAKKLELRSEEQVLLDMDGEFPGRLPATFEIVPLAVRIFGV